jgi:hypothetical protein
MARETLYFMQAFVAKGAALKPEQPIACKNEAAALRAAQRAAETRAGAVAFSNSGDAELGDYDEDPVILLVLGRVPERFQA